jgi:hypothetical protein
MKTFRVFQGGKTDLRRIRRLISMACIRAEEISGKRKPPSDVIFVSPSSVGELPAGHEVAAIVVWKGNALRRNQLDLIKKAVMSKKVRVVLVLYGGNEAVKVLRELFPPKNVPSTVRSQNERPHC